MNELYAAWNALEDYPTAENLDTFLAIATRFTEAGGALPPEMARRYQLATGAQPLQPVVVTEPKEAPAIPVWALVVAVGLVVYSAIGGDKR